MILLCPWYQKTFPTRKILRPNRMESNPATFRMALLWCWAFSVKAKRSPDIKLLYCVSRWHRSKENVIWDQPWSSEAAECRFKWSYFFLASISCHPHHHLIMERVFFFYFTAVVAGSEKIRACYIYPSVKNIQFYYSPAWRTIDKGVLLAAPIRMLHEKGSCQYRVSQRNWHGRTDRMTVCPINFCYSIVSNRTIKFESFYLNY